MFEVPQEDVYKPSKWDVANKYHSSLQFSQRKPPWSLAIMQDLKRLVRASYDVLVPCQSNERKSDVYSKLDTLDVASRRSGHHRSG